MIPDALHAVLPSLRCPICTDGVLLDGGQVRCGNGHSFDVARQGYVAMLTGRGASTGDTAAMVAARDEVLAGDVLVGVVAAVADAAAGPLLAAERDISRSAAKSGAGKGELVLDLAGGTGHYLAAVLERAPERIGLVLDASAPALRRAARSHPRAAAVAADAWGRLPIRTGAVACALSVFGPRNPAELVRVLAPAGRVVVAAPAPDHLGELVERLGLVRVDPRKDERQRDTFAAFEPVDVRTVRYRIPLDHAAVAAVVAMGPSANHVAATELGERVRALPELVDTTVAVTVTGYVRRS